MEPIKPPYSKILVDDYEDAPKFLEFFDGTKTKFNPPADKSNQTTKDGKFKETIFY